MRRPSSWSDLRSAERSANSNGPRVFRNGRTRMTHSHSEPRSLVNMMKTIDESNVVSALDVMRSPSPAFSDHEVSEISHHLTTIASMIDPDVAQPMHVESTQLLVSVAFVVYSSLRVCASTRQVTFCWRRFKVALQKHKYTVATMLVAKCIFWIALYM